MARLLRRAAMVVAAVATIVDLLQPGGFGWWIFLVVTLFGIPLSFGAAVLRYRLYDIDIVITAPSSAVPSRLCWRSWTSGAWLRPRPSFAHSQANSRQ
jgi:hypothetical protein